MSTFPKNQDIIVKLKSELIFVSFVGTKNLNNPPYEKCYNKRVLVLSPLISFKSLVNKGGSSGAFM